jgi:hypothetical protein
MESLDPDELGTRSDSSDFDGGRGGPHPNEDRPRRGRKEAGDRQRERQERDAGRKT